MVYSFKWEEKQVLKSDGKVDCSSTAGSSLSKIPPSSSLENIMHMESLILIKNPPNTRGDCQHGILHSQNKSTQMGLEIANSLGAVDPHTLVLSVKTLFYNSLAC